MSAQQAAPCHRHAALLLARAGASALADRVLTMSAADQTRVTINSELERQHALRRRQITTSGGVDRHVGHRDGRRIGRRRASATTNVLDDASLKRTVDLAERLARLSPEDPGADARARAADAMRPSTRSSQRTADLDPEARAAAVQARGRRGDARPARRPAQIFIAGFLEANARASSPSPRARAVRLSPHDRRGLLGHRAHAGRHRQRLGERRRARLGRDRRRGARPHRRAEGRGQPQPAGDRAGSLHGGARAAGGHRPRAAARRRAQRAQRRRRPQPVLEARRRHAHRREDRRRARHALLRSGRSRAARPAVRRRGPAVGRMVWIENGVLRNLAYSRFWAQKQGEQPTGAAARRRAGADRRHEERPRS